MEERDVEVEDREVEMEGRVEEKRSCSERSNVSAHQWTKLSALAVWTTPSGARSNRTCRM